MDEVMLKVSMLGLSAVLLAGFAFANQPLSLMPFNSSTSYSYCDKPQGVPIDGAIVHFGSRYLLMCNAPIHPHGERMSLLSVNRIILSEDLSVKSFTTVRMTEQISFEDKFQRHLRLFNRNGEQILGGVNYKKFESKFAVPAGHHRDLLFEYSSELNPQLSELPAHWISCAYSIEEPHAASCRINVEYHQMNASVLFLRFRDNSNPMPWERFHFIASEVIRVLEYSDVTDHRELWPEGIPVYE